MTYENHWQRRTFDSGTRRRRALGEPPAVEAGGLTDRTEAFAEAIMIARLYEDKGANASAVRLALEARARTLLDETPPTGPGRAAGGVSSSGATGTDGKPSSPPEGDAPLDSSEERDLWLIARGFDMAFRALGIREPQSLKVDAKPKLRVVE